MSEPCRPKYRGLNPAGIRDLQALLYKIAEPVPSARKIVETESVTGGPPFPSVGYWFPNLIPATGSCYVACHSDQPYIPHHIHFVDSTGAEVGGRQPVHFFLGYSGLAFPDTSMLDATKKNEYSLRIVARGLDAMGNAIDYGTPFVVAVTLA
jgi:hypothetical protein